MTKGRGVSDFRRILLPSVLFALALCVQGCSLMLPPQQVPPVIMDCMANSDCTVGSRCVTGVCVPEEPNGTRLITDTLTQSPLKALDVLFVVDNSGSMKEEQEKLARSFPSFLDSLFQNQWKDVQIGIISTDMQDPKHQGRLQGSPKILSSLQLDKETMVRAFAQNVRLGIQGSSFEKPLAAMKAALSPKLLSDPSGNRGFMRKAAALMVIFVTDEDDCSHQSNVVESEVEPAVCTLPRSQFLLDPQGHPVRDVRGHKVRGILEELLPTTAYIEFLKSLGRRIFIRGLIGDPTADVELPASGCSSAAMCNRSGGHFRCTHTSATRRACGGCRSKDGTAEGGFRLHQVIEAFVGGSWSPICGDHSAFEKALQVRELASSPIQVQLRNQPAPGTLDQWKVEIRYDPKLGKPALFVERARAFSPRRACSQDSDCGKVEICGQDQQCYSHGWVYFSGKRPTLKLSGLPRLEFAPSAHAKTLRVSYPVLR